jgi:hypothetical protein
VIDLSTESPLPLKDACRLVPPARDGKRTHLSTLLRWILRGAKGPDGRVVRLDGLRLGSRWVTSREALQRFAAALTPRLDAAEAAPAPAPRTPAARRRAGERAAQELSKVGI